MTAARRPGCCATSSSAKAAAPASFRSGSSPAPGEFDDDRPGRRRRRDVCSCTRSVGLGETTAGGTPTLLAGAARSPRSSAACASAITPDAFFQTNTEMAEQLYGVAAEYAGLQGWERVYDLFCGIGTIGLTLAAARR